MCDFGIYEGNFGDIMEIKKIINEFDYTGIKKNYDEWIKIVYDLMIKNKKIDILLDDSQLDYLVYRLIEVINEKLHEQIELSHMEIDVFLHSFICYVLDKLNIKSLIGYTYIEPDGKRLMNEWDGACVQTEDGCFVYYIWTNKATNVTLYDCVYS